jgi:hypothetical protein
MDGAPFLTPLTPGDRAFGMSTEGILRLFTGESLSVDPPQLDRIKIANPGLPTWFGQYDPIDLAAMKAIFWTPINDAIYLYPHARCPDKTVYPVYNGTIDAVLGTTSASMSVTTISALWRLFLEKTDSVPFKAIIRYPTDHLENSAWQSRIDLLQESACGVFAGCGWKIFSPTPDLEPGQTYWAHYSTAAKHRMWEEIAVALQEVPA